MMRQSTTMTARRLACVFALLVTSAAAGCMEEQGDGDEESRFAIESDVEASAAALAPAPEAQDVSEKGDRDNAEVLQDCVFIEWCNEPGSLGTICRVRSACRNQCGFDAIFDECDADAVAVCGRVIEPSRIRGCP